MQHDEEVPVLPTAGRKRRASSSQPNAPEAGPRRKRAKAPPPDAPDAKPSAAQLAANDGNKRPRELRSSRRVKRERQGPDRGVIDLSGGEMKRENSPICLPVAHIGGVIDLTLDDE